jgi:hypothetical protein
MRKTQSAAALRLKPNMGSALKKSDGLNIASGGIFTLKSGGHLGKLA